MKRIILCSAIGLVLICVLLGCSQENGINLNKTMAYSDEQIEQIEEMKRSYGIDVTIPYKSTNKELPSIQELNKLFKCIADFQHDLYQVKEVEINSSNRAEFIIGNSNLVRLMKRGGDFYTGSYSDTEDSDYGNFHFCFKWEKFDINYEGPCSFEMSCTSSNSSYDFLSNDFDFEKKGSTITYNGSFSVYTIVCNEDEEPQCLGTFSVEGSFDLIIHSSECSDKPY